MGHSHKCYSNKYDPAGEQSVRKTPAQDRVYSLRAQRIDGNVRPSRLAVGQKEILAQDRIYSLRAQHLLIGHEVAELGTRQAGMVREFSRTIFAGHCFVEPNLGLEVILYVRQSAMLPCL